MGNRLHLALVQHQGGLNQGFAIAGGAGACDPRGFRKKTVDVLDGADGGCQRIAVVAAVEGIEQSSVLAYQGSLGGGASGVDSQEAVALVSLEISPYNLMAAVTLLKFGVFMLIGKERPSGPLSFRLRKQRPSARSLRQNP